MCFCALWFRFRFSSFLPFRLYSSAVIFSFFLFSSALPPLAARPSSAQFPFLHSLRWGIFALSLFLILRFLLGLQLRVRLLSSTCFGFPPQSFSLLFVSDSPSSHALVTLLQGCLSGGVRLGMSFSLRLLRLCIFLKAGGGGDLLFPLSTFWSVCSPVCASRSLRGLFSLLVSFVCFLRRLVLASLRQNGPVAVLGCRSAC